MARSLSALRLQIRSGDQRARSRSIDQGQGGRGRRDAFAVESVHSLAIADDGLGSGAIGVVHQPVLHLWSDRCLLTVDGRTGTGVSGGRDGGGVRHVPAIGDPHGPAGDVERDGVLRQAQLRPRHQLPHAVRQGRQSAHVQVLLQHVDSQPEKHNVHEQGDRSCRPQGQGPVEEGMVEASDMYRQSVIGTALLETLNEMVGCDKISLDFAIIVLLQFDKFSPC